MKKNFINKVKKFPKRIPFFNFKIIIETYFNKYIIFI